MSTENRRGMANGDAGNDVGADHLAEQGKASENGADGGKHKDAPANILAGGVDQAAAYVPPTPPPRHARTKTLDMKRVRVASSADPRNAPTQKIILPRTPPPGAAAAIPPAVAAGAAAGDAHALQHAAPEIAAAHAHVHAHPQAHAHAHGAAAVPGADAGFEEPPAGVAERAIVDERHRMLQVLVVLLSTVAVLIIGAVIIILRMNRQQQPQAGNTAPTMVLPMQTPPAVQTTAELPLAVPTTAAPQETAAPVLDMDSVPTAAPTGAPAVASTAAPATTPTTKLTGRIPKPPKPETTTTPKPTTTSQDSPIFELPN